MNTDDEEPPMLVNVEEDMAVDLFADLKPVKVPITIVTGKYT